MREGARAPDPLDANLTARTTGRVMATADGHGLPAAGPADRDVVTAYQNADLPARNPL